MNNQNINDRNTILIILGTILIVFLLIFSFIPSKDQLSPPIQWKDMPNDNLNSLPSNTNNDSIY